MSMTSYEKEKVHAFPNKFLIRKEQKMYIPAALLIMIGLWLLAKYLPSSNFSLPAPTQPYLNKLKQLVSVYSFDFKRDLLEKAKELLKKDYEIFKTGAYRNGNYIEDFYTVMFSGANSQYEQYDIIETWAICAIIDFNGVNSSSDEYNDLRKNMKSALIKKYEANKCPTEIYRCFTNSNSLIQEHKETNSELNK